jgi:uncharacterized protein YggE
VIGMKRPLWLAVAVALLAAPALAETTPPPAISVTGEANVSVPPDQAQIEAGVASDAKTAREASDVANAAMSKVLLALKGAGIDQKDYQTSRLSLQPQFATYSKPADRTPGIVSFRASNRVTVKIRDVTKVANVIDVLVGAGANDIGSIHFTVTQASKHLDEAREKAIADARRKAEIYAKAAGVTLGEPISISEEGAPTPVFRGKVAAPMAAGAQVAPGEETLSVTVSVSWAIKPKE